MTTTTEQSVATPITPKAASSKAGAARTVQQLLSGLQLDRAPEFASRRARLQAVSQIGAHVHRALVGVGFDVVDDARAVLAELKAREPAAFEPGRDGHTQEMLVDAVDAFRGVLVDHYRAAGRG